MNEVWKFRIPFPGTEPWVLMPAHAKLLHVAVQDGAPYIWALVSPNNKVVRRHIVTYATGQPIDGSPDYLGTFHLDWTVWHVFCGGEA